MALTSLYKGVAALAILMGAALAPLPTLQAQQTPAPAPPLAPFPEARPGPATAPDTTDEDLKRALDERRRAMEAADQNKPATTAPAGRRGGSARGGGFPGAALSTDLPVPGEGPTCAFDTTVYDVRLPVDQIGKLDVDALTRAAATPDEFEKALAALGPTLPEFRVSQSVRLAGDMITIGAQMPYITNSQVTSRGDTINSVTYRQVGATFTVAGKADAPDNLEVDLNFQVSTLSDTGVPIAANVRAPMFRIATLVHKGKVAPRKPFVIVSVDAARVDSNGKAAATIARVTMGVPQLPAKPANK